MKALDLSDETEALWLRALVWPSIPDRAEALARAIDIWHQHRPDVRKGDALDLLPGLFAEAPADTTLCLFHCHVLNQFPAEAKERLETLLLEASASRPLYRLALEGIQVDGTVRSGLEVFSYVDGMRTRTALGHAHPHGRGLFWSASASA